MRSSTASRPCAVARGQDDMRTGGGERLRGRRANPAAGAGDEREPPGERFRIIGHGA